MMTEPHFKILDHRRWAKDGIPSTIPWRLVEPLRQASLKWHGQTLERINERGGFGPTELWAHVNDPRPEGFSRAIKPEMRQTVIEWFKKWSAE